MTLRYRGLLLVLCSLLTTLGCSSSFYISESEAAAFRANLRNQTTANDLLSSLQGKLLTVEFTGSGSNVQVASSNLAEILRGIPNFFLLEQLFRQVRLDRISRQIEQGFGPWIASRVRSLEGTTGVRIGLRRATIRFLSPPTMSYSEPQQSLSFEAPIALTLGGSFTVNGDRYSASLTFDRFLLRGQMRLGRPFTESAWTWLRLTPQPGGVRVGGGVPSEYQAEIRRRIGRSFSSPLEQGVRLHYDHFALSGLKLSSNGDLDFQYHDRPETAPPVLNVVVAEGGKLYYTRKSSGDWAPFEEVPLPGRGGAWPALAASGQGQLELAFVSSSGEFVYVGRRQGDWVNAFQSPSQGATLFGGWKPALIATAPGQVEAVVVGRDGRLYHFRRKNGAWIGPSRVDDSLLTALPVGSGGGTFPLRDPVGVQSGSRFFLFFIDSAMRLFAVSFDMETGYWGQTKFLEGAGARFAVSAASCGDGRVDVLSLAPDGAVYQHTLIPLTGNIGPYSGTAFSVGPPTRVGGPLTATPAAACSGFKELQIVGRGPENSMFHARQYVERWEGWEDAGEHFFGTLSSWKIEGQRPAIASTRDGAIHVVARQYGVPPKGLVYNHHITTRFPLAPAAVHWRGFQRMGSRDFFGTPALALFDRQLVVATRGADQNVWQTALAEENVARFARVQNSRMLFPWEPVTLSSSPRALEVLYPAEDGTIRHVRLLNRYEERHTLPRPPAPGDARPVAAVTFGGQIEVVSAGSNGILYHWRFISGFWSQPTAVGGPVFSNPLLADVGSGQLELLAVAGDQRLHRWRFIDGHWSPRGALPTSFPVSPVAFGPGAASSWGDGTLDVAVVHAGTSAVHHARLRPTDLGAGGRPRPGRTVPRFQPVGERASDVPLLSALAPDLLHLVVTRGGGLLAGTTVRGPLVMTAPRRKGRRSSPQAPPAWRRFQPIMAPSNLLLGNLVTVGERELALIAVNRDGRAYLARYAEPHWSVAAPLGAQTTESMHTPLTRPALAVH